MSREKKRLKLSGGWESLNFAKQDRKMNGKSVVVQFETTR